MEPFRPFIFAVPAPAIRPVVAEVEHDGLFRELKFLQFVQNSPDVPINIFAHGQNAAGCVELLFLWIAAAHFDWAVLALLVKTVGHLKWRVGSIVWQIAEERPILALFYKRQGVIGQVVNDKAFAPHDLAVVFEDRVEILSPVSGTKAVEFVEAACVRMVRILCAVVPFAESRSSIASSLERVGDGFLVEVQSFRAGRDAVHAAARMVSAG